MSAINMETVTEKYPWNIQVSPRKEFSTYFGHPNKHAGTFNASDLAFDYGFMEDVDHTWSYSVSDRKVGVVIWLPKATSNHIVSLCEVHLELISGEEIEFSKKLQTISDDNGERDGFYKDVHGYKPDETKTCYKTCWPTTQDWDDSIDNIRITFVFSKQTVNFVPKVDQIPGPSTNSVEDVFNFENVYDAIVVCDLEEFPVNRRVLSAQSPIFKAMFRYDMEESNSGRIVIDDCESDVLEQLLKFMHTGKNPEESEVEDIIVDLYDVALEHGVTKLKDYCEYIILKNVTVDNAIRMCSVARLFAFDSLKVKAVDVIKKNKKKVFGNAAKFKDIVDEFPEIVLDLLYLLI